MQTVKVFIDKRPGGGIRVWSDELPGLLLSGSSTTKVLAAIEPAARALLRHKLGVDVNVQINATFIGGLTDSSSAPNPEETKP